MVAGNSDTNPPSGGIGTGGGIYSGIGSRADRNNSTVSGNVGSAAIYGDSSSTLTVNNSTVSGNEIRVPHNNLPGLQPLDRQYLLHALTATGDLNNTAAGLDPSGPQSNGGPTQTVLPLPGSPAICLGSPSAVPAGATDQRGFPRPNTTYTGHSSTNPCVDTGAVQGNISYVTR